MDSSLLVDKVLIVMHHNGKIYNSKNIQQLLDKRYMNAQIRKQGGRHKGPPPFTKQDQKVFEQSLLKVIHRIRSWIKHERIVVYRGASKGHDPLYVQKAYDLGKYFAEQGYELVFGAGSIGIMGAIQDGVLDHGGKAIGVMPKMLDEHEITSQRLTELIFLVDSMHERKNKMAELADAFVMAPAGAGSLEEFFEMYSWVKKSIL